MSIRDKLRYYGKDLWVSLWYEHRVRHFLKTRQADRLMQLYKKDRCWTDDLLDGLAAFGGAAYLDFFMETLFPKSSGYFAADNALYQVTRYADYKDKAKLAILQIGMQNPALVGPKLTAVLKNATDSAFVLSAEMLILLKDPGIPSLLYDALQTEDLKRFALCKDILQNLGDPGLHPALRGIMQTASDPLYKYCAETLKQTNHLDAALLTQRLIAPPEMRRWTGALLSELGETGLSEQLRGELMDYRRIAAQSGLDCGALEAHASRLYQDHSLHAYGQELEKFRLLKASLTEGKTPLIQLFTNCYSGSSALPETERDELITLLCEADGGHWALIFGDGKTPGQLERMAEFEALLPKKLILRVFNAASQQDRQKIAQAFMDSTTDLQRIKSLCYRPSEHFDSTSHSDAADAYSHEDYTEYDDGGYRRGGWFHTDEGGHEDVEEHEDGWTDSKYADLNEADFDF